jgi:serine/threonine protein kinase
VLYGDDASCLECGARPDGGWPELGPSADPWLGTEIGGRYLLTRGIGAGSSGAVYRAESLAISRQFAVKIVALDADESLLNAENIQARLNREIGALGQLRNPHIVSFYDVLPIGDRAVALLMDLIEGRTLQDVVSAAGSLKLGRALKILRQIANGVHEAHQAGMIHRDLKPENIMIERLPAGDDFVHILDFGIVHRLDDVRVTQGFLGTPLYASPEQAVGGDIDRRADIYALGAVFFFMLAGRPPFFDDNVYTVLKAHVGTKAPRLRDVAPDRRFPDAIEDLVAQMLAKNPGDRPQSLAGVIDLLDEISKKRSDSGRSNSGRSSRASRRKSARNHGKKHAEKHSAASGPQDSELHQTVQSDASLIEAASSEASQSKAAQSEEAQPKKDAPRGFSRAEEGDSKAPKTAIFRRRRSDTGLNAVPKAPAASDAIHKNTGIYPLPAPWYGENTVLRDSGPGNFTSCYQDTYWSVLDVDNRVITGSAHSSEIAQFKIPESPQLTAFCLRESDLITGHADGALVHWDGEDRAARLVHQNAAQSAITSLVCNENHLLFGTASGALYAAEFDDAQLQPLRIQSGPPIRVVAIGKLKSSFAVARANGHIDVYDMAAPNTPIQRITPPGLVEQPEPVEQPERVEQLAFSRDGYLLAVVFESQKMALYQALTGMEIVRNDSMFHRPLSIHFNAQDQLRAFCKIDREYFGWDLQHHIFSTARV